MDRDMIRGGTGNTTMDDAAFYRLLAWLSPSYPVGAFAYSHGVEWAVEDGTIRGETELLTWVTDILELGGGRSDGILFCAAHAAVTGGDLERLSEINELALALAPSSERRLETAAQGTAFLSTTLGAWAWADASKAAALLGGETAYPVAVATAAAGHGIPVRPALHAYLHAFAANLVSAGVRLIPLGQSAGQRVLAALEGPVAAAMQEALAGTLDSVGGAVMLADVAAIRHETQYTRLFRS